MFGRCRLVTLLVCLGGGAESLGQELPRQLTLDRAIEIALTRHADLDSASAAIDARIGAERQAAYSPNPILSIQSENWRAWGHPSFSVANHLDLFVSLSQPLETGRKKSHRVRLAARDRRIAELQRQAAAWRIRQSVKLAYWGVLAAERRRELLSKSIETFGQVIDYHDARVSLGAAAEADLIKVRLEGERFEMAHANAVMQAERVKVQLVRSLGLPPGYAPLEVTQLPIPSADLDWERPSLLDGLMLAGLDHHPEALLAEAYVQHAEAATLLAKARSKPNLTPFLGYKRASGFNTLIGGISVPLPLRDRNTGRIAETVAEVRQSKAQLRAVQASLQAEVRAAHLGVAHRAGMLRRIETDMLGPADETLQIAVAAHREGASDLFRLLDAQRARIDVQLLHSQTVHGYAISLVELESAVGSESLPLPEGKGVGAN